MLASAFFLCDCEARSLLTRCETEKKFVFGCVCVFFCRAVVSGSGQHATHDAGYNHLSQSEPGFFLCLVMRSLLFACGEKRMKGRAW